jgi:3-oxoacyl-[acyl-carrier protein] reductase
MSGEAPARSFVVTGCASGIGRHLATKLVRRGRRLFATDIREEALRTAAVQDGWPSDLCTLRRLDVTDAASWQALLGEADAVMGGVDVLLNVAGYLCAGNAHEAPSAEVHRHFDVNAKGVIFGTQAAAQRMIAAGRGHIVNIASMAALAPIPGLALYSASKHAVRAFSLAVADELRPHGVYVTVVCPDAVQTPMLDIQKDVAAAALTFTAPRILSAEEVARAILGPVLEERPMQFVLPPSRGWLAVAANALPGVARYLAPVLRWQGRRAQTRYRQGNGSR